MRRFVLLVFVSFCAHSCLPKNAQLSDNMSGVSQNAEKQQQSYKPNIKKVTGAQCDLAQGESDSYYKCSMQFTPESSMSGFPLSIEFESEVECDDVKFVSLEDFGLTKQNEVLNKSEYSCKKNKFTLNFLPLRPIVNKFTLNISNFDKSVEFTVVPVGMPSRFNVWNDFFRNEKPDGIIPSNFEGSGLYGTIRQRIFDSYMKLEHMAATQTSPNTFENFTAGSKLEDTYFIVSCPSGSQDQKINVDTCRILTKKINSTTGSRLHDGRAIIQLNLTDAGRKKNLKVPNDEQKKCEPIESDASSSVIFKYSQNDDWFVINEELSKDLGILTQKYNSELAGCWLGTWI